MPRWISQLTAVWLAGVVLPACLGVAFPAELPFCAEPIDPGIPNEVLRHRLAGPDPRLGTEGDFSEATVDHPASIDVMIVYTPASSLRHGGAAGMESLILNAMASANEAFTESRVHLQLSVVRISEVEYVEDSNISHALARLAMPGDGFMDEIHAWRDECGADLVVLVDEDTSACGTSYLMRTVDPSFARFAFSVVNSGCIASRAMTHEMGHNMGCHHDVDHATGSGAFPFSHALRRCAGDGSGFRTVMSYACPGAGVPALNLFSNPDLVFDGMPVGQRAGFGDPGSDNARTLNLTAHVVASFRSQPDPPLLPPIGLVVAAQGSRSITLRWQNPSLAGVRHRVERSDGGSDFQVRAVLEVGAASYLDLAVTRGRTYAYRLVALDSTRESSASSVVTITTPAATRSRARPTAGLPLPFPEFREH